MEISLTADIIENYILVCDIGNWESGYKFIGLCELQVWKFWFKMMKFEMIEGLWLVCENCY